MLAGKDSRASDDDDAFEEEDDDFEEEDDDEGEEDGMNTYFFGNLHGAGRVASVVRHPERWPQIVPVVEAARTEARSLLRSATPAEVAAPWRGIGALKLFGPNTASRLLVAERPDVFLMPNKASRNGLADITGVDLPKQMKMPKIDVHYQRMIVEVRKAPWWRVDRPRAARDGFLWECRIALLDVFAYNGGDVV